MWDEIIYPFPNVNGCTVDVWEWVNSFHALLGMWLLILAGIKIKSLLVKEVWSQNISDTFEIAPPCDLSTFQSICLNTGPCITNVFATCRKNFSQWHRSFQRKLRSHWLKFLRHVTITLVIQGPGHSFAINWDLILQIICWFVWTVTVSQLCKIALAQQYVDNSSK